jgi:hypothetical protein
MIRSFTREDYFTFCHAPDVLRALILAGLGIPVCAALFSGAITFLLFSYSQGEPPGGGDLLGAIAFGGLSLVVVILALRASRKTASIAPTLARATPILVLVGAVAGAFITVTIYREAFEAKVATRERYCREHLKTRASEQTVALCLPEAKLCDREVQETTSGLSYGQRMRECLDKRLGALALMGKLPEERSHAGDDPIRPVYPTEVKDVPPIVERLCDVLHGLPKRRKAECCGRQPGVVLTSECVRNLAGALADGAIELRETNVDACENAMKSSHQGCEWVGPHPPEVPEACLGLLRGMRQQNEVCRSSLECGHGLRCLGSGPTHAGRCTKPPGVGSLCNTAVDPLAVYTRQDDFELRHPSCADGFCDRNRCVDKIRTGGGCKANEQCLVGRCAEGRCVDEPTADVGEACLGGDCIEGTRCVDGKCAELKPLGAACNSSAECTAACVDGKCNLGCDDAPLLKKLSPPSAPRSDGQQ